MSKNIKVSLSGFLSVVVLFHLSANSQHLNYTASSCKTYLDSLIIQEEKGLLNFGEIIKPLSECLSLFEMKENWTEYVQGANILTEALHVEKKIKQAEMVAQACYKVCETKISDNTKEFATACHNLAFFEFNKKNFAKAIFFFEKAIDIETSASKFDLANSYNGLADIYKIIGDTENAKTYFEKAILLSKDSLYYGIPGFSLGLARTYKLQKKHSDAIKKYKKCIELCSEIAGKYDDNLAYYFKQVEYMSYNDLADIYIELNNLSEALYYSDRALQILKDNKEYFEAYKQFEIPAKIDFH